MGELRLLLDAPLSRLFLEEFDLPGEGGQGGAMGKRWSEGMKTSNGKDGGDWGGQAGPRVALEHFGTVASRTWSTHAAERGERKSLQVRAGHHFVF